MNPVLNVIRQLQPGFLRRAVAVVYACSQRRCDEQSEHPEFSATAAMV
jgi:hypothetical protein